MKSRKTTKTLKHPKKLAATRTLRASGNENPTES